jgi:hypothetical protein
MAGFEEAKVLLHKTRVKLVPNYLKGEHETAGKYIALTESERTVLIDEICQNMKERGSFEGNADTAMHNVREFFNECMFLLCDGWELNMKYFSIKPHIAGSWNRAEEAHDREKHPIRFAYRTLKPLRDLAEEIAVEVTGIEEQSAYIAEVLDVKSGAINENLTVRRNFIITGSRIQVSGDPADCGLFLVRIGDDGSETPVKVEEPFVQNSRNKLVALMPDSIAAGARVKVRIITDYAGSGTPLKANRTLDFGSVFTVIADAAAPGPAPAP